MDVSGAVLAGGRSQRMGRSKATVEIEGTSLLDRAIDALRTLTTDIIVAGQAPNVVGHPPAPIAPRARMVADLRPDAGPLAGIETALTASTHPVVVVVAIDHPWIEPAVLRMLVDALADEQADAAMLGTRRGPQPLVAAYRRRALPTIQRLLDAGERRATSVSDHLATVIVSEGDWRRADPQGRSARDLDTPEDLAAARRHREVDIARIGTGDRPRRQRDLVVVEEPLEIRAHGPSQPPRTVVTTMRTPGHDLDLAVGWMHSEGLLAPGTAVTSSLGDPVTLARPDDQLTLALAEDLDFERVAARHAQATASCGICGRAAIDEVALRCPPVAAEALTDPPVAFATLATLPDRLREAQDVFSATGGLHATGLFDAGGALVTLREDVGRHNALDAAIGARVLAGELPLDRSIAVLSGRVGFELVVKAAMAGIPVLAAVGAPSDLAVRTAQRLGVTLVGFLRQGTGNVYTHAHRIDDA